MSAVDADRADRIGGDVAPGFEGVRDAFTAAVEGSGRGGAALAIMVNGETAVDLWGGSSDPVRGAAWDRDTPTTIFSCSKGLMAILAARLVESGLLDLDAPVSEYWPEFAQAGKAAIPVRWILSHRAGLSYPVEDVTRADIIAWDPVVAKFAAQAPLWEPGSAYEYHALSYGWLIGEVLRRITGTDVGTLFRERLVTPLGVSAWLGLPRDRVGSVAVLAGLIGVTDEALAAMPHGEEIARAVTLGHAIPPFLAGPGTGLNEPELQTAVIPAGNVIATARALAAIWSSTIIPTAQTVPLDEAVVADMTRVQSFGPSWLVPGAQRTPNWATGFMVDSPIRPFLSAASFGHDGAGGQLAFADPSAGVGFAFLTSDLGDAGDRRAIGVLDALRDALA